MPHYVIFDLGGVLIHWEPRLLYRKLFHDEAEMEAFLGTVCTSSWNEQQDAGRPIAQAVAELTAQWPQKAALIHAYYARWTEMAGQSRRLSNFWLNCERVMCPYSPSPTGQPKPSPMPANTLNF